MSNQDVKQMAGAATNQLAPLAAEVVETVAKAEEADFTLMVETVEMVMETVAVAAMTVTMKITVMMILTMVMDTLLLLHHILLHLHHLRLI